MKTEGFKILSDPSYQRFANVTWPTVQFSLDGAIARSAARREWERQLTAAYWDGWRGGVVSMRRRIEQAANQVVS